MREIRSYGSVGEPVGNHRLYPDATGAGKFAQAAKTFMDSSTKDTKGEGLRARRSFSQRESRARRVRNSGF